MRFGLFELLIILALIALWIVIIRIPIIIAKNRGITDSNLTTIAVLSWFGLFFGITWVIALVLSLVWQGNLVENTGQGDTGNTSNNMARIAELHKLKKSGAITQKEFETAKKKWLK
ncbi:MAG: SHOCT domain-containing protein [Alphaproteobacteria bacterium]|nr:SHOCT domain-containing protein [Alphaproteobacteria bacterium]